MNTSSIPQPTPTIPVLKPTFHNIVVLHDFDYPILQLIATMAGVSEAVISMMLTTVAIHRADAEKILAAFSEYTQESYTLDTVRVALHPTFTEMAAAHNLDLSQLATEAGVSDIVIDNLLIDQPIPPSDARLVLQAASRLSRHHYTLDNIDITLNKEPEPHA